MMGLPNYYESPHEIAGVGRDAPVLLALSGGADSTSLLHNLVFASKTYGFKVFAAHVNHNIRLDEYNNEAARDEAFCREICDSLGVKLFVLNVDVPSLAQASGESIEGAARRVRYEFFSKIMAENGISLLVTAHNANDNFETQLFNLCRGCGVSGMVGIPKMRTLDEGGVIVRPILSGSRAEILDFCRENNISFVTDSTNFELDATRNKLRNTVIPTLEGIFPVAQRSAARLSVALSEISDYMRYNANNFLNSECDFAEASVTFSAENFNSLHIALKKAILMEISKRLAFAVEGVHIADMTALIERATSHSSINLPCGFVCAIERGEVVISRGVHIDECAEYELPLFGETIIEEAGFLVSVGKKITNDAYSLYASATLCGDKIKKELLDGNCHVRSRREGDKIVDGGNTKKLKKLMCDKKIPISERNSMPLLCLGSEIIYVPMCAISDVAKRHGEGEIEIFIYKKS